MAKPEVNVVAEPGERAAEVEYSTPDVTVIVLAYSMERWSLTCDAVESVLSQTFPPREIILCIDGNVELADRLRQRWPHEPEQTPAIRVVERKREERASTLTPDGPQRRSSYASHGSHIAAGRNAAVKLATTEIVAFLDDDATANPDWLQRLLGPFSNPSVLAVGGAPLPVYAKPRPRWFPAEFDWVFGCAYAGLPTTTAPVLRLIGANMAARRKDILAIGGLRSLADDLDMSHRLLERSPRNGLIYEPRAIVHHYVHEQRLTWRYFMRRCVWTSRRKVAIMRALGGAANLQADRRFVRRTLSVGVTTGLREFLGGDVGGLERASSIVVALGLSAVAYTVGLVEWNLLARRRRGRGQPEPDGDAR
jgi:cellulose synthase/poly-beta-1,6-N-acetylglucosamine synthase-like glycosyltransferase